MHLPDNTLLQSGKYRIVRAISSGGFGCTYEAVHTLLATRVAVKEFFPKDFCNRDKQTLSVSVATQKNEAVVERLRKKFIEEARALFEMQHKGIVRVTDVFEENNTAYFAMDFIDGPSLQSHIARRGTLPEQEALELVIQVADALCYVHSLNRLHLDIKPGNIMLKADGTAVLIDFGASKHYNEETGLNDSDLLGVNTPGYAPVEQMDCSFTHFSPSADVYSLAATLYKLLTGLTPPNAIKLLSEEATLAPLPDNISYTTRTALKHAMQVKRKDRTPTVEEFVKELKVSASFSAKQLCDMGERHYALRKFEEARRCFIDAAKLGSATAHLHLGHIYRKGQGVAADYKTAFQYYELAAKQGNAEAEYNAGAMLHKGLGVKKDLHEARRWYNLAKQHGYRFDQSCIQKVEKEIAVEETEALARTVQEINSGEATSTHTPEELYQLSKKLNQTGKLNDSRKLILMAAEAGHVEAQYETGLFFHHNSRNPAKALEWYTKAAEQGHASAQFYAGLLLSETNKGIKKDYKAAFDWFLKAAEQGHVGAQIKVGQFYRIGTLGIARDIHKAVSWFQKAASQGNASAQIILGDIFFHYLNSYYDEIFLPNGLPVDRKRFIKMIYVDIPKDTAKAIVWYKKAAELGSAEAMRKLGDVYYEKALYKEDNTTKSNSISPETYYKQAFNCYEAAAKKNDARAQMRMGKMYEYGFTVKRDLREALKWYEKAAEREKDGKAERLAKELKHKIRRKLFVHWVLAPLAAAIAGYLLLMLYFVLF